MSMLNQSIQIGPYTVNNRLVMPPMATGKAGDGDSVTPEICAYYNEKTHGGYLGLVIAEHCYISPEGKAHKNQISISKGSDVEGLKQLVDTVHQNHAVIFAQISHAGGATNRAITGYEALSASATADPRRKESAEPPRAMEQTDIDKLIRDFVAAAKRAKAAGFDGVELHAAHGYLLCQFYSPLMNKRTDAYTGATVEGRVRLQLEIIAAIRAELGDYPVAVRLGAADFMEGGSTIDDGVAACRMLEQAGVCLLDISGGMCGTVNPLRKDEEGYFFEATEAIKKVCTVPVMLTGGIVTPGAAEALIAEGKADLIGIGRALLRDSDWAEKALRA